MSVDLVEAHGGALAATRILVAGIAPDQWFWPTPCDDWNVRTLVNHIVSGNFWVAELAGGKTIEQVGTVLDGDILGEDPTASYDASMAAADGAVRTPGALQAPCAVSYGPVPGEVYFGHRLIDVLIHGWDLAKATGQDASLDPGLLAACWEVALPQAAGFSASGAFGTTQQVQSNAPVQDQLLAMLGRSGSWPD